MSVHVLQSLADALRCDGVSVVGFGIPATAPETAGDPSATESIVVVADRCRLAALLGDGGASRRQLRAWGNETAEWAVTTALAAGAGRLIVVCDARGFTFGQRTRAIDWLRRLAHQIGYECRINGADGFTTAAAVIDRDADVAATAAAVAAWHRGRDGTSSSPVVARPPARPSPAAM